MQESHQEEDLDCQRQSQSHSAEAVMASESVSPTLFHPCTYPGCGKTFNRRFNLASHALVHSERRPFECQHW
jgi:hypothetical protein